MNWILLSLFAPFMWALVNHLDKYLIDKLIKGRGIGSLAIFSALVGLPVALFIAIIEPLVFNISLSSKLVMILNGMLYIAGVIPYLYALVEDEASSVAPLFQLSSVMILILGYFFLNESLSLFQILGSFLIFAGSLSLTLDLSETTKPKLKKNVIIFMLLASFFTAVNAIIFKTIALEESFLITSFWEYIGVFLAAGILFLIREYRVEFIRVITKNTKNALLLNGINEMINIFGKIAFSFAGLLVPIALVSFVAEGFQPVFVLVIGVFLTIFFPHISTEDLSRRNIIKKTTSIAVIFIGTYLIS